MLIQHSENIFSGKSSKVVLQCNNEGVQKLLVLKSTQTTGSPSSQDECAYKLYCYCITLNYRGSGFMSVLLLLYAVSWWGIKQLGSYFGSIFFLFPIKVARGQFCSSHGNLVRA